VKSDPISTISGQNPSEAFLSSPSLGRLLALFAAGIITALLIYLGSHWLQSIEERFGALAWTLASDSSLEERITLVVVDEASIAEVGPWPWSREVMAELVDAIDAAGAQLQIHDIVYPESRLGDDRFVGALSRSSGAIIAQVPVLASESEAARTGLMTHGVSNNLCGFSVLNINRASSYIASADAFSEIPKGHNSAIIERDGGIRKSPSLICVDDIAYPSLTLAAFLQLGISSQWMVRLDATNGLLEPPAYITIDGYPGLSVPVDKTGAMRVDFTRAPDSFRAVSASDVLAGRFSPELFDNAWVILGGTAFGLSDIVPTPYSGSAYGVELQARLLASVLDMSVPFTPNGAFLLQIIMAVCFAVILYWMSSNSGRISGRGLILFAALFPALALGQHIYILSQFDMWIGWLIPSLYGLIAVALTQSYELAVARVERARVYQNLTSYLSPFAARQVAFSLPSSQIDAKRTEVTLLSADVRNFAAFGESRPPEEIAAILHYFSVTANAIIESHGGRVAEFRGDSVLAIWEGTGVRPARDSFAAAEALQDAISDKLLQESNVRGLEPMALGVGIDQGPVLIGSIGPSNRRSFTILGDTVSTTLRIQEMTGDLSQPILMGSAVARHLPDLKLQSQGSFLLPGLQVPHVLFAPLPSAEICDITIKTTAIGR